MLFNSIHFLFFFPIATIGFFALPPRWRHPWLLVASCYFYMAFIPSYILILFTLILVDYTAGLVIEGGAPRKKKVLLIVSLAANLGIFGFFKYWNFINGNLATLWRVFGLHYPLPQLDIILPIGLSFHTFQSLAYVMEVYRGNWKAERNLGTYALYVLFYPQMVAGPIERPQGLLRQLRSSQTFDPGRVVSGLELMLWGFFKKLVIADHLAVVVKYTYSDPRSHSGLELLLASYAFAFQIFCDFSGYSDIAIGAARVMGFDLVRNFNRPYAARSISDFWHRWHISLSTWFRDYLYIPLGGSHVGRGRLYLNLMIVFALSGLWHGANWTFLCWGLLNGFYLVFGRATRPWREKAASFLPSGLRGALAIVVTFHLVVAGWVFFRAESLPDALYIVCNLLPHRGFTGTTLGFGLTWLDFRVAIAGIVLLEVVQWAGDRLPAHAWLETHARPVRWAVCYAAIFTVLLFGRFSSQEFIYFQF